MNDGLQRSWCILWKIMDARRTPHAQTRPIYSQHAVAARPLLQIEDVLPQRGIFCFRTSSLSALIASRFAKHPDAPIIPDLKFCLSSIPPPHKWNHTRTASVSELLPVADFYGLQPKSLAVPAPLRIRKPRSQCPLTVRRKVSRPTLKPDPYSIEVPGAYTIGGST